MKWLVVWTETKPGDRIDDVAAEAQGIANKFKCKVGFLFNGVTVVVAPGQSLKSVVDIYEFTGPRIWRQA